MAADRSADFGSKLRAARERKGITLRQISNRTKISVAALEALERNDISRLPGGIFSRAFVRSYAVEVGLEPEATIQEFVAQFPHDSVTAGHPGVDQIEDNEALESDRRVARTVLGILVMSIPLAGAVLYFTMANRSAPVAPAVEAPARPSVTAQPSGSAQPAASEPPSAAAPSAGTTPSEAVPPSTGADTKTATPSTTTAPGSAPTPPAAESAASSPAAVPASATLERLTVVVSARRPVWVSATVDGQKAIERLLQPGDQETMEVSREMVLTAGDAAALNMTLNGEQARALGKSGEVVTARLNLNNFKNYLQPR